MKRAIALSCVSTPEFLARQAKAATPKTNTVGIGDDGMVTVNSRREFIHGLYMLPKGNVQWSEARDAGFNLLHTAADPAELAKAHQNGLYAWVSLGSIPLSNRSEAEANIRTTVNLLKGHPALLFWETEDEPSFVWKKTEARVPPQQIIETARFIKGIDPTHPLYLNHSPTNLVSTLQCYNEGSQIIATDIYPVIPAGIREMYALWPDGQQGDLLNPSLSQVGQYADKMRFVAGPHRAVFMVLQAFAWENLREKDRDPKMILYPTREQLRFMAWQSVVHGVNGLLWWGLAYTPLEAPLWSDLKSVAAEIKALQPWLSQRRKSLPLKFVYHDIGHSVDRGIEWTVRRSEKEAILIAVNADRHPVEVTIQGLEKFRNCEVLFESRSVKRDRSHLRDSFAPFDTHIYRAL